MIHTMGALSASTEPHKFFACSDQPARQRPQVPRRTVLDRRGPSLLQLGPLPKQGVSSTEDGVPRAPPARSGSLRIAPALRPAPILRAPPGPPRCRPASRASRLQRTQGPPRRSEWTPKRPARVPRRTLIPTRVPPRRLDSRRLQEPPPPPPLPPPPLARRGGEGRWRGSALAPPPLRPRARPGPRSPERRAQSPTPGSPAQRTAPAQGSLLSAPAAHAARRVPKTPP